MQSEGMAQGSNCKGGDTVLADSVVPAVAVLVVGIVVDS